MWMWINRRISLFSLWLCYGRFGLAKKRAILAKTELNSRFIWRRRICWYYRVPELKRASERLRIFDAVQRSNAKGNA
jgi:hypothetical protein